MGYSYTVTNDGRHLLDCDHCGRAGGVRKIRCPYGYCPAPAFCPACRKLLEVRAWISKKAHQERGCERAMLAATAQNERRRKLLNEGKAVRRAALGVGSGPAYKVHVLFERADGTCEGWYMSEATYSAFPLLDPHTPDDYRRFGELLAAPGDFYKEHLHAA